MEVATARNLKISRILAFVHIITGFLLLVLGIVDRVHGFFWSGEGCFGIWCGIWMCITGSLGIQGSARERTRYSNGWAGVYMGFSITSAAFGGIIIIAYSSAIARYSSWYFGNIYSSEMALSAIILILGITEFVIGIWAAVMSCLIGSCDCCSAQSNQPTSVVYMSGQGAVMGSYVMGQGAGGVPVAFPMQQAGGVVTVPGGHPQIVHMPAVGMVQPQTYHLSTTGAGGGPSQTVMVPQTGMQRQMVHGAEGSQLPMFYNTEAGQPQFVTVSPAMQGMEAPENQALVPPPYNGDQQFPVKT